MGDGMNDENILIQRIDLLSAISKHSYSYTAMHTCVIYICTHRISVYICEHIYIWRTIIFIALRLLNC